MKSNKKQTYLNMALILMVANLTVRVIGGIFKIPLMNLLGSEGYANFSDAYALYTIFFAISTAGLPVAISRMISYAGDDENYLEEKKIFKLALISFILVGAVGTGLMICGAKTYAVSAAKNAEAYYSILMLAPTLFFVCVTSAFRGYFQGRQNMFPTAISEVIEALGKLCIGIFAAVYAINKYGVERLDIAAAFAISGLTIGSAAGVLYLFIKKYLTKRSEEFERTAKSNMPVRKSADILKEIIKISVPIMLTSSVASLSGAIDTFMMKQRLMDIGWEYKIAKGTYGAYTGMAVPLFSLPNTLVVALAVSIIPVITSAFKNKNMQAIKSTVESSFRVASIISMPCAFGLICMSKPILNLLYSTRKEEVVIAAPLLSILGIGIIFVSMMSVTNSMLQAQKQENKTFISMLCGIIVKIIVNYILIGIPAVNKYGTPVGTCLCYLTVMCINFYFLAKYTKITPPVRKTFIKPFIASAIMSICTILSYMLLNNILHGSKIAVILALIIAVAVYMALVILFKTLTRDDVLLLPKGANLYEAMKNKKLID